MSHHGAGGLWGWLGVMVGPDRGSRGAGMQAGGVWQLRVLSGKGWKQSPSLPHHSLHRQHSCHVKTINLIVLLHPEHRAGEPGHPPATGPLPPCTALHLQLIRVRAELSLWQPKQEERRLGDSQG